MKKIKTGKHKVLHITLYILFCSLVLAGTYYGQLYLRMYRFLESHMNDAGGLISTRADILVNWAMPQAKRIPFDATDEASCQNYLSRIDCPPFVSGGLYLVGPEGQLQSSSDLITGCPDIDLAPHRYSDTAIYSTPYIRSTDELSVITIYQGLTDGWMLAADIPLTTFAEKLPLNPVQSSFYHLLDTKTGQILTASDASLLGQLPKDVKDPLYPERLHLLKPDDSGMYTLQDSTGRKLYWGTTTCRGWTLIYYQTPDSLYEEASARTYPKYGSPSWQRSGFRPLPGMFIMGSFLVLLGLAIFLPKRTKMEILEANLEPPLKIL